MLVIHRVAVPGILDRAVRADDAKMCVILAFEAKPTPAAEARGVGSRTDYAADGGVESHDGAPAKLLWCRDGGVLLEPGALGVSATETVLHALAKPVVGLDVLPCYVDFGKTKNIGGVAVDDLTKMAIFGLIIVVGKASALDTEDAEIVFFIVTVVAVETACVK